MDFTIARPSSASSLVDAGLPRRFAELLELAARLTEAPRRGEAIRALAEHAGAVHLLVFVVDHEIGVLLPAPGFPQTLPDAGRWRSFLDGLSPDVPYTKGVLPYPRRDDLMPALGVAVAGGAALVLLGGTPDPQTALALRVVLPVLASALRGEQAARAAEGHAAVARHAASQAKLLASSLDNARHALQGALGEAEAANNAKDQFLAVLSHELRTPLAPVLTTVTALLAEPGLGADLRNSLEIIRRNTELEVRLIDDLLDLTRVAKGKMPLSFATVDAHALVRQTLEICQSDIYRKGLNVTLRLDATEHQVRADPARLHQVLWNLVKNAIKFTPEGGRLELASTNEGRQFRIDVTDSGIGIEPQFLDRIFDAFEQTGGAVTRRFGGLGLGLAIAKALVQAHDGKLVARSAGMGEGATFSLTLSVVSQPSSPPRVGGSPPPGTEGVKRLRLLLVEDHRDTAAVMSRLLRGLGHEVATAGTVAAALRLVREQPFDLVLSDLGLPDGSGMDLMRELKQHFGLRGVAISGYGTEDDVLRAKDAGFIAHLTKPVNFQQVQAILTQFAATNASRA